ncbi:hypothetical protein PL263_06465 [Methylomonas sp. EFPC3]|uniref:alpha/beta hydrolase family protein n=1 Tax=Methylomonas sp. EFPC3 TaxID=3021710 RepID=UPI0024169D55|nr:alpha/beta hydrolase [Methylomonas sp. EFPC3]WFP51663.1 hypothetical protein PL263_06465 [Methylomonas sp. EFPC3]
MKLRLILALALVAACSYVAGAKTYATVYQWLHGTGADKPFKWPDGFDIRDIPSSVDGKLQKAYFYSAPTSSKRPLLISLHYWAGNYATPDALAVLAKLNDWNYIHPDFRGPAVATENCLSDQVIADLEDAVSFALTNANVDLQNIYVVGFSGGAYTALGWYSRTRHPVKAWLAWAPITDLAEWQLQTKHSGSADLSDYVLACTGSGAAIDAGAARARSPLYWPLPTSPRGRVELYAGIKDGHKGTVPIAHSLAYFNRLVDLYAKPEAAVESSLAMRLLTQGEAAGSTRIGDRVVFLQRDVGFASLTVYDGGHELLADYCFDRLLQLAR